MMMFAKCLAHTCSMEGSRQRLASSLAPPLFPQPSPLHLLPHDLLSLILYSSLPGSSHLFLPLQTLPAPRPRSLNSTGTPTGDPLPAQQRCLMWPHAGF